MRRLKDRLKSGLFLMDGAMGTQLQLSNITDDDWDGREGCNEVLNLSRPDLITSIHACYLNAGSDAVETNTFGAAPGALGEYGLAEKCLDINRAAAKCAREAADAVSSSERQCYAFGSIGPGTKLPSLGQISFDELRSGYALQIEGLLEGGVDGLLFETCQDILQVKAGLCAAVDVLGENSEIPLYVSVTIEDTGTMLVGTSMAAVVAILAPFPISVLGMNCATGPRVMRRHLQYLNEHWLSLTAAMPNAGLPEMRDGEVAYPLGPAEFADITAKLTKTVNLNIVGGCCGSTPAHIEMLRQALSGYNPASRSNPAPSLAASLYSPVELSQDPAPLFVGERANATGSRKFRETIGAGDYESAFEILSSQEQNGAHILDLSCAYADGNEVQDFEILTSRAARECRLPLMLDSTQTDVIEAALKLYGGRAFINSINFEDGEKRAGKVAALAKRYGAGLVCLTIDEEGMARTVDRKVDVAKRLVRFCEEHYGIGVESIFIDPLTFTIGSGDDSLRDAAMETIEAVRRIKDEIPGVRTLLGVSNISFGLKLPARKVINALFLDMCVKAGLDAAIVNVAQLLPLNAIDKAALAAARALLENDNSNSDPLIAVIEHFEDKDIKEERVKIKDLLDPEQAQADIVSGKIIGAELIDRLLRQESAEDILNNILVPGMAEVGRLFNDGQLQLPFVLKSAEVMKRAVDLLKPHMKHEAAGESGGTMVLATVAGDVHDIGKNLVDIILSNNGFKVVNLGTKISAENMVAAVREHNADALGMSGLLVKSTVVMSENIKVLEDNGIDIPVFFGGAALTENFVAARCQSAYSGSCVYCADAFAGLDYFRRVMNSEELPAMVRTEAVAKVKPAEALPDVPSVAIDISRPPPVPPFFGYKNAKEIEIDKIYELLDMRALVRGRWGYRQFKKSDEEYNEMLRDVVYPEFEELKRECSENGIFEPCAAWGYFKCRGEGNVLKVEGPDGEIDFEFPRGARTPNIAIPDYFRRDEDVVAFIVVTMGPQYMQECKRLHTSHDYHKYLFFHGLAAELTDSLAMYWHSRIRSELGFPDSPDMTPDDHFKKRYRGVRYGFGYSACPDLEMNKICCELVHAAEIGVSLTENFMMIPEVTTCAIIIHNKAGDYH